MRTGSESDRTTTRGAAVMRAMTQHVWLCRGMDLLAGLVSASTRALIARHGVDSRRAGHTCRARVLLGALVVGGMAAAAAGCAGTSHSTSPDLPLSAYLVQGNDETGLHRTSAPATSTTAELWTAALPHPQAQKSRLVTEGFDRAVSVQTGTSGGEGVSWVIELGSTRAAVREQAAEIRGFVHVPGRVGHFAVPGVPTATGFTYPGPEPEDANALFRGGRCLLLVGDQLSAANYRAPVIAAVRAIWNRTDSKDGPCAA
jgi:hypothetical protein